MRSSPPGGPAAAWLPAIRRYLLFVAAANLAWEIVQMPLYTAWHEARPREIAFDIVHCTGGDVLIALLSLMAALVVAGDGAWPRGRFRRVAVLAVIAGIAYTVFSEWLNTKVRGAWAYTDAMPTLPIVGTGLTPLAQWAVIPSAGFWLLARRFRGED